MDMRTTHGNHENGPAVEGTALGISTLVDKCNAISNLISSPWSSTEPSAKMWHEKRAKAKPAGA